MSQRQEGQRHDKEPKDPKPRSEARNISGPGVQGEGNYEAARRYNSETRDFIEEGKVEPAADEAAPTDRNEAREMDDAEEKGRAPARK